MPYQTIFLHAAAPPKPAYKDACNGCGVCCAAEPCPIAQLLFWQRKGACPALFWQSADAEHHAKINTNNKANNNASLKVKTNQNRYVCGLVLQPETYFLWLPQWAKSAAARFFKRAISAGKGCDSTALIHHETAH